MDKYYISQFITKQDYAFTSSFFSSVPFEEERDRFLYTSYELKNSPVPGYLLILKELKRENEAEMEIEISYVAFIPLVSIDHFELKNAESLTEEQMQLFSVKEREEIIAVPGNI